MSLRSISYAKFTGIMAHKLWIDPKHIPITLVLVKNKTGNLNDVSNLNSDLISRVIDNAVPITKRVVLPMLPEPLVVRTRLF